MPEQIISFVARRQHLKVLKDLPATHYLIRPIVTKVEYFPKVFRLAHPKVVGLVDLHQVSKFVFGQVPPAYSFSLWEIMDFKDPQPYLMCR